MKRLILVATVATALAPAALGQESATALRAEMLLGSWACKQVKKDDAEGDIASRFTYAANGGFSYELAVNGAIPHGPPIELSGKGAGTWTLKSDPELAKDGVDRLAEIFSSFTITSATLNGQAFDLAEAQAMWGGNPLGKDNEALALISPDKLGKLSTVTGGMTRCVRPE